MLSRHVGLQRHITSSSLVRISSILTKAHQQRSVVFASKMNKGANQEDNLRVNIIDDKVVKESRRAEAANILNMINENARGINSESRHIEIQDPYERQHSKKYFSDDRYMTQKNTKRSGTKRSHQKGHNDKQRRDKERARDREEQRKTEASLRKQVDMLESFTSRLKATLTNAEEQQLKKQAEAELQIDEERSHELAMEQLDNDADEIYKALMAEEEKSYNDNVKQIGQGKQDADHSRHHLQGKPANKTTPAAKYETETSLFPSAKAAVELPAVFGKKVIRTRKYLNNPKNINWIPVIQEIEINGAFEGANSGDVASLLKTIPREQIPQVIHKIDKMIQDAQIPLSLSLSHALMASYNVTATKRNSAAHNKAIYSRIEQIYNHCIEKGYEMNLSVFGMIINTYGKQVNIPKIKEVLKELELRNLSPNMIIYTTILQAYIRMDNYKLASDTFHAMKFLSTSTSPSQITYTSMILMDLKHNNIEHALNLYDEMLRSKDENLKPTGQTVLAMAKACTKRVNLTERGWQFIIDYYSNGFKVDNVVMELMMTLAWKDNDMEFVRCLYLNLMDNLCRENGKLTFPSPIATRLLFKSYSAKKYDKPLISDNNEKVRSIKIRTMELVNFNFHAEAPPFLPTSLTTDAMILAEAKAMWSYVCLKMDPNVFIFEDYLYVHIYRASSIEEFNQLFEKYTFFKNDAGVENLVTMEEPLEIVKEAKLEEEISEIEEQKEDPTTPKPTPEALQDADSKKIRFPRTDILYTTSLNAARIFRDLEHAQKVWIERGKYRKTTAFQQLSIAKQEESDFRIAKFMLRTLVEMNAVMDGYRLVLSSKNRFLWSYYHLHYLVSAAKRKGLDSVADELIKVANDAAKFLRRHRLKPVEWTSRVLPGADERIAVD